MHMPKLAGRVGYWLDVEDCCNHRFSAKLRRITTFFSAKKNKRVSKICLSVLLPFCQTSVPLLPRYMVLLWFPDSNHVLSPFLSLLLNAFSHSLFLPFRLPFFVDYCVNFFQRKTLCTLLFKNDLKSYVRLIIPPRIIAIVIQTGAYLFPIVWKSFIFAKGIL